MPRRVTASALVAALLASALLSTGVSADPALPLPDTMAAVGDSITQAASTAGSLGVDAPQNSWATGTASAVNSHYLRLLALGAPVSGRAYNRSVSGAKVGGLDAQMQSVIGLQPDYLTVLIGGNDLCTDTAAQMTSVIDFRAQFATAMVTLANGSPDTNIYVVSIPDVYQLWNLFKGNWWARIIWSAGTICQSLLANPTSTQQVDVDRRLQVRQRNIDFNTQLAEVCATYASRCRFDNNAVFNTQFTTTDLSGDYFHPSVAGQAKLAAVSWGAGYAWSSTPPPNVAPTASFTSTCASLTCTFTDTSTDADGSIASRSWAFGDGAMSTAQNPSRTYALPGTYTVQLTVTDNGGATASAAAGVAVSAPPPAAMWVGGLSATTSIGLSTWRATVTIQVVDGAGAVSGVAVAGLWSTGSGATTCTTGSTGRCSVRSSWLSRSSVSTVRFTVSTLTKAGRAYDPTRNVATLINVPRP